MFASSFLPSSFMVFLFIFAPSPQFFWSVRLPLPFLFWWPHCGCALKMCPNYWESSLVRSNSLELWGFLLNYAICFSRHWRPGGPAFNISIHVQQKEKEGKIKRRGQWRSEGKMYVCAWVCLVFIWYCLQDIKLLPLKQERYYQSCFYGRVMSLFETLLKSFEHSVRSAFWKFSFGLKVLKFLQFKWNKHKFQIKLTKISNYLYIKGFFQFEVRPVAWQRSRNSLLKD